MVGHLPQLLEWRTEVRMQVTRSHRGEQDPRPGLREVGPHHLAPSNRASLCL